MDLRVRLTVAFVLTTFVTLAFVDRTSVAAELKGTAEDRLKHDLKYLADDELEGRGVGTDGLNLAADFIKEQFKPLEQLTLEPYERDHAVVISEYRASKKKKK